MAAATTSSPARPSTATPTSPSAAATSPRESVATTGPGLTEPGIHVVAQPGSDGNLEVSEQIRTTNPVSILSVVPPRASVSGTAGAAPTVTGLQATAGGSVVSDVRASRVPAAGVKLNLPAATTDVRLRYRLESSADRSQPAPAGRVLIVLPPITAPDPGLGALPVVVEVVGGNVHNVVCPDLPASDQLCGRQHGAVWSTTAIPLGRSTVIAQLDLPQPGAQ